MPQFDEPDKERDRLDRQARKDDLEREEQVEVQDREAPAPAAEATTEGVERVKEAMAGGQRPDPAKVARILSEHPSESRAIITELHRSPLGNQYVQAVFQELAGPTLGGADLVERGQDRELGPVAAARERAGPSRGLLDRLLNRSRDRDPREIGEEPDLPLESSYRYGDPSLGPVGWEGGGHHVIQVVLTPAAPQVQDAPMFATGSDPDERGGWPTGRFPATFQEAMADPRLSSDAWTDDDLLDLQLTGVIDHQGTPTRDLTLDQVRERLGVLQTWPGHKADAVLTWLHGLRTDADVPEGEIPLDEEDSE